MSYWLEDIVGCGDEYSHLLIVCVSRTARHITWVLIGMKVGDCLRLSPFSSFNGVFSNPTATRSQTAASELEQNRDRRFATIETGNTEKAAILNTASLQRSFVVSDLIFEYVWHSGVYG